MQHDLKRREAITVPTSAIELYELGEVMCALIDRVTPYDGKKTRSSAKEVFEEFTLRCRLVEAIGAFLRTKWVTDELRAPYEELLVKNEAEVDAIQKLAEQRWLSFEMENAMGGKTETIQ